MRNLVEALKRFDSLETVIAELKLMTMIAQKRLLLKTWQTI